MATLITGALSIMTAPGIGTPLLATFDTSTCAVSLSAPTSLGGAIAILFDVYSNSTGLWTPGLSVTITINSINSGINKAATAIAAGTVDGIRPNIGGSWTGALKIFIGIWSGGLPA